MEKKLYGCKRCNKIGYVDPCLCTGEVYNLHLPRDVPEEEKPSIGEDNVFDRIDKALNELMVNQHNIIRRIESLEETTCKKEDVFDRIGGNFQDLIRENKCLNVAYEYQREKIIELENKIKSLELGHGDLCDKVEGMGHDIKSLEDRVYKAENYIPEGWSNYENKIKSLEECDFSLTQSCELQQNKISALEDKTRSFEILVRTNINDIYKLIAKLESKEKIQFEHESKEQYNKRINREAKHPHIAAENVYDYPIYHELKDKYDKLLDFVKSFAGKNHVGNCRNFGLYAEKLLKELGES